MKARTSTDGQVGKLVWNQCQSVCFGSVSSESLVGARIARSTSEKVDVKKLRTRIGIPGPHHGTALSVCGAFEEIWTHRSGSSEFEMKWRRELAWAGGSYITWNKDLQAIEGSDYWGDNFGVS